MQARRLLLDPAIHEEFMRLKVIMLPVDTVICTLKSVTAKCLILNASKVCPYNRLAHKSLLLVLPNIQIKTQTKILVQVV